MEERARTGAFAPLHCAVSTHTDTRAKHCFRSLAPISPAHSGAAGVYGELASDPHCRAPWRPSWCLLLCVLKGRRSAFDPPFSFLVRSLLLGVDARQRMDVSARFFFFFVNEWVREVGGRRGHLECVQS